MSPALSQSSVVAVFSQNILDAEKQIGKFLASNKHLWRCLSSGERRRKHWWYSSDQQLCLSSNSERLTSRKNRICMLNLKASAFYNLNSHSGKLHHTSKKQCFTKTPREAEAPACRNPESASSPVPELNPNSDSLNSHSSSQNRCIGFTADVKPIHS